MNYKQALEYVKKNGITKFIIDTDKWKIPECNIYGRGKIQLYFNLHNKYLSSYNANVAYRNNNEFWYDFVYQWLFDSNNYEWEFEIPQQEPKRWDMVHVWDDNEKNRVQRIFLTKIEWAGRPFISVIDWMSTASAS